VGLRYTFNAILWEPQVEPAWVFITVPEDQSDEISESVPNQVGFGSVRVAVTIGTSTWKTSLFPSKRAEAYVLPVKRAIRDAENLDIGDTAEVSLEVLTDG
jgi:hypothetical protein